jgi:hypothetical protein
LILTHDTNQRLLSKSVQFCKYLGCKLFVLFVVESSRLARLASLTHQNTADLQGKIEEDGWRILYSVEDDSVENGVSTSLHLEKGNLVGVIKKYIEVYRIDICIIERKSETKKIFSSVPIPVIGF